MGAKSAKRRNFEGGFVTTDSGWVREIMEPFDRVWMGAECEACQHKKYCADYSVLLVAKHHASPSPAD